MHGPTNMESGTDTTITHRTVHVHGFAALVPAPPLFLFVVRIRMPTTRTPHPEVAAPTDHHICARPRGCLCPGPCVGARARGGVDVRRRTCAPRRRSPPRRQTRRPPCRRRCGAGKRKPHATLNPSYPTRHEAGWVRHGSGALALASWRGAAAASCTDLKRSWNLRRCRKPPDTARSVRACGCVTMPPRRTRRLPKASTAPAPAQSRRPAAAGPHVMVHSHRPHHRSPTNASSTRTGRGSEQHQSRC